MRVLIADDDRLSSRMLEASLNASGYEVIVAGDGGQAWQVLKNDDRPQIAILDWMMPVSESCVACRRSFSSSSTIRLPERSRAFNSAG